MFVHVPVRDGFITGRFLRGAGSLPVRKLISYAVTSAVVTPEPDDCRARDLSYLLLRHQTTSVLKIVLFSSLPHLTSRECARRLFPSPPLQLQLELADPVRVWALRLGCCGFLNAGAAD